MVDYREMIRELELPESLQQRLIESLEKHRPDKKKADEIIAKVSKIYNDAKYEPCEAIGVIAAQSISEPATQMTMRSYHFVGAAGREVTLGLPRLIEIVDARRIPSTPTMEIYMDEEHNTKEAATELAARIKESMLKSIALEDTIDLVNSRLLIKLKSEEIARMGLSGDDLVKAVRKNARDLNVEFDKDTLVFIPKKELNMRELQKRKVRILNTQVSGTKGISHVIVHKDKEDWVVSTIGSNLKKMLHMPGVDTRRTICNDIREVEKVLGIEAARNIIIREADRTLSEQGLDVDVRHLLLVSDAMCADATIKPVGRYGVAGEKGSVLARANFEITVKNLLDAAVEGEEDELDSIIENVMINQVAPVGTGMCDLVFHKATKKKRGAA
ncbi:MAG: DNA-directed RNA polymerase subunit A'' [Candidatus Aenigmarchaeota archaeon]|nr:DNA-directed RNA polymerase subunit A'' [Candidatus Aenigmarchaeota archaeon]